jgi:two-component system sensor histidine kinase KdpD
VAGEAGDPAAARLRSRLERERKARREAEAIAENATRRLYAADELKSQFIANVTHELRTPLAAMKGSLAALSHDWDLITEEDRADVFGVLLRNADALGKLIDQLLDFSRAALSPGVQLGVSLSLQVESLSEMVTTADGDLGPAVGHHIVVVDVEPDVWVRADPAAVRQVLANLLENAAKYSPRATTISVDLR